MPQPFGQGARARGIDRRDFKIGLSQPPVSRPAVYMPDHSNIPVKMQGKYGTCGGHAGATMEAFLENVDLSPKYCWKQTKALFGQPGQDVGVDMRSIFKALQNKGDCHESLCPDTLDPTFAEYSDPTTITDAMLDDAYPYGVTNYAFTDNPSMEQLKQAVFTNCAAILLVDCGDAWWVNGYSEAATCPVKVGNYTGGHFVVAWGYDETYVYFRNYWDADWGRKGDGYFDASYVPHVREMGVGIAAPSVTQQLVFKYQSLVTILEQIISALKSAPVSA
jgi:hypothetical protein